MGTTDISSNISDLEAAYTGEGLREALLRALQDVERIHRRNWWEINPYLPTSNNGQGGNNG